MTCFILNDLSFDFNCSQEFDKFDGMKFNKAILKRPHNNMNIYDEIIDFVQYHISNSLFPCTAGINPNNIIIIYFVNIIYKNLK